MKKEKNNHMSLACHPFGHDKYILEYWIFIFGCFQYAQLKKTKQISNIQNLSLPNQYKIEAIRNRFQANIIRIFVISKKRRETHCRQKERVLWTKYKYLDHSVTWWRQISFYLKLPVANWRRGNRKKSFFYFCISQTWLIFAPQYIHYDSKLLAFPTM